MSQLRKYTLHQRRSIHCGIFTFVNPNDHIPIEHTTFDEVQSTDVIKTENNQLLPSKTIQEHLINRK